MMNSTARKRPPVNGCTDFNGRVWRREELLSLALSMHGRCGEGSNEYGAAACSPGCCMEDRGRLRLQSAAALHAAAAAPMMLATIST